MNHILGGKLKNPFKRDDKLKFDKKTHRYFLNEKEYVAATGFLGKFFGHFDPYEIAKKVSQNLESKYFGMEIPQIQRLWRSTGTSGHRIHKFFEDRIIEDDFSNVEKEKIGINTTLDYLKLMKEKGWEIYPEVKLFNNNFRVAGTADLIFVKKKKAIIGDFKTNEKIPKTAFGGATGMGPAEKVPDSKFDRYALQANLYQYMLESEYGFKVIDRILIHVSQVDDAREKEIFKIKDMQLKIKELLSTRFKNNFIYLKAYKEKEHIIFRIFLNKSNFDEKYLEDFFVKKLKKYKWKKSRNVYSKKIEIGKLEEKNKRELKVTFEILRNYFIKVKFDGDKKLLGGFFK